MYTYRRASSERVTDAVMASAVIQLGLMEFEEDIPCVISE